jgi:hypothetical protein
MSIVSDDFRNLVYKLCEGREVPLLVTDIISGYLVHQDLFNINKLSRRLNSQANAVIYQSVVINLDGSKQSIRKASLLFRTLLTSETATQAVHTLSLAGDPLQSWRDEFSQVRDSESVEDPLRGRVPPAIHADITDFTQAEIELYSKVAGSSSASMRPLASEISVWALYLHLLQVAPQIQDFSVSSDYFRFPDFRSTVEDMARGLSMEKLRSCSLCLDLLKGKHRHASVVQHWDSALLALFAVPNIQSIAAVASLKSEAVHQLRPGGSSITRLTLHHYQIQDYDLGSLLAVTSSLRYLKYHAITDHAWRHPATLEHGVGLEPLYDALHHVSDSLQELHISQHFDEDSIHFDPDYAVGNESLSCQKGQLSSLKRLHTLTIPYATLLGFPSENRVWDWDNVLPLSLSRIVLTDNLEDNCRPDCWTDKDLMPVFSTLVERLPVTQRGNEAAEFGLHLADLEDDFNEPVRQELTRMCEECGVQCSIEKVYPDRPKTPTFHMARGGGRGGGRGNLTRGRGRGRGT